MIKACGVAQFNADIKLPPTALELAVVFSTQHHALIKSVDTSVAVKMPGVVGVMTAEMLKEQTASDFPCPISRYV